jgi:hypoxanthine phosphoribosyltransferase
MLSDSIRVGTAGSAFIAIAAAPCAATRARETENYNKQRFRRLQSLEFMAALPILFSSEQIAGRVAELAAEISRDYSGETLLLVGVLKGAAVFLADLARELDVDASFDFISVASYKEGTSSSGQVRLVKDLDESIEGRNVLLVEDILDTGLTLNYLTQLLLSRKPKSLKVVALLDKPSRRARPFKADYVGFIVANQFVVGYGMDHAERYRNLPDIRYVPSA